MARLVVVLGLMFVVFVVSGCPRKIETNEQGSVAPTRQAPRPADDGGGAVLPGDAGRETAGDDETDAGMADEAADESVDEHATADSPSADTTDVPDDALEENPCADGEPDAGEETVPDGEVEEAGTADEEPVADDGVDEDAEAVPAEEAVIDEEPFEEPSFTPEPPQVKLSREAVRFAGSWQAVVYDFGGESENATGERIVLLADTGAFEATALNPAGRLETGIWGMEGDIISLSFGPAGDVVYTVDQPADNIAIWHGPNGGAMFCIRLPDETTAMSPGENYESGFGPVAFSRSGPGYWKGSYGDPEGNLVLQNTGSFLYGTWEQGKQAGYAILEFNQRGFEGFWWYSGQVSFGGEWNGEMQ